MNWRLCHFATVYGFECANRSYNYLQAGDTHPTFRGRTVSIGGSGGGSSGPRAAPKRYRNEKLRTWRGLGHERMGWAMSKFTPAAVQASDGVDLAE